MQFTYNSPSACRCPHNKMSQVFPGFNVCINSSECNDCEFFVLNDIIARTIECSFVKEFTTENKLELFLSGEAGIRYYNRDNTDKLAELINENNIKFDFEGKFNLRCSYIVFVSRDKINGFKKATSCTEEYWFSHFEMNNRQIFNMKDIFPRPKIKPIYLGI